MATALGTEPEWEVVLPRGIFCRERANKDAAVVGTFRTGAKIFGWPRSGWVELRPAFNPLPSLSKGSQGFVLIDGTALGLSRLLAPTWRGLVPERIKCGATTLEASWEPICTGATYHCMVEGVGCTFEVERRTPDSCLCKIKGLPTNFEGRLRIVATAQSGSDPIESASLPVVGGPAALQPEKPQRIWFPANKAVGGDMDSIARFEGLDVDPTAPLDVLQCSGVWLWSDLHVDSGENLRLLDNGSSIPASAALLLPGDVATSLSRLREALVLLLRRFAYIFFLPGNHELWVHKEQDGHQMTSLDKFLASLELCRSLGVRTTPAILDFGRARAFVLPLFGWYCPEGWGGVGSDDYDMSCRWPLSVAPRTVGSCQPEIAAYFLSLNSARLAAVARARAEEGAGDAVVLVCSHFLPRPELFPGYTDLLGFMGTLGLDEQARSVGAQIHCFGHSHMSLDVLVGGVRYVQNALGGPRDWGRRLEPQFIFPGDRPSMVPRGIVTGRSDEAAPGVLGFRARWFVRLGSVPEPSTAEFSTLVEMLPLADRAAFEGKIPAAEKQRQLASLLLVRLCCAQALEVPLDAVVVKRTKGSKYFCGNDTSQYPCFTLNTSHEGDFIVLAAESCCVVGVDVAAPEQLMPGWTGKSAGSAGLEWRGLNKLLGPGEWARIERAPESYSAFQQLWACKEAFRKAIGENSGVWDLFRPTFDVESVGDGYTANVQCGSEKMAQWSVDLTALDGHWIAVARGPREDVVDEHGDFRSKLSRPAGLAWSAVLAAPPPWEAVDLRKHIPERRISVIVEEAKTGTREVLDLPHRALVSDLKAALVATRLRLPARAADLTLCVGEGGLADDVALSHLPEGEVVTLLGGAFKGSTVRPETAAATTGRSAGETARQAEAMTPAAPEPPTKWRPLEVQDILEGTVRTLSVPEDGTIADVRLALAPLLVLAARAGKALLGLGEVPLPDDYKLRDVGESTLSLAGAKFKADG